MSLASLAGAQLPSTRSAERLIVEGEPFAALLVARDWAFRGLLIHAGMKALGRDTTLGDALAGSAGIEAFVLLWVALTRDA